MTDKERVRLWDAINRYAAACGGDTSKRVYGNVRRQVAVAEVEQIIRDIESNWASALRSAVEAP